jgi:PKD repeat protein
VSCEASQLFDGSRSVDPDSDPLSYSWDFGDGSVGQGRQISHVFSEGGVFPVSLTVDDGTGLANSQQSTSHTIMISRPPIAVAGDDRTACAGDVILFDASASSDPDGGVLRYRWEFGDGTSADVVNPTKVFESGGVYTVALVVEDDSGLPCSTAMDQVTVKVAQAPIAVGGEDRTVCANTRVVFDGTRSRDANGTIRRFAWDFDDGTSELGPRVEHIFNEPGTYRVLLTVTGEQVGDCNSKDTDEILVTVQSAAQPKIDCRDAVPVGVAVVFDGSGSSGEGAEIEAWRWDFGDEKDAQGETVTHAYDRAGRYTVTLTTKTAKGGACPAVSTTHVVVVNDPPTADAGEDQLVGVDQLVTLSADGSRDPDGAIVTYEWDLGDGSTASGIQVRHRYRRAGTYTVLLRVQDDVAIENSNSSDSMTVTVNAAPIPAIVMPAAVCAGEEVLLNAGSSTDPDGSIADVAWSLGDQSTAEGSEVVHTFAKPGSYQVTVRVDDGLGVSNSRQELTAMLKVNSPPLPDAGPDRVVCPGQEVRFDGAGSVDRDGRIVDYLWDFGDGSSASGAEVVHRYSEVGTFTVALTATDDSATSCSQATDEAAVRVNGTPTAVAGGDRVVFTGGANDAVLLDVGASADPDGDSVSYQWDFGDGGSGTGPTVFHEYAKPGVYTLRLTVRDGSGLPCGEATSTAVVTVKAR